MRTVLRWFVATFVASVSGCLAFLLVLRYGQAVIAAQGRSIDDDTLIGSAVTVAAGVFAGIFAVALRRKPERSMPQSAAQVDGLFDAKPTKVFIRFGSLPQRAHAFQLRTLEMARLRKVLRGATAADRATIVALTGQRGVGKTQLAAAYARQCMREGYALVAWINSEDTPVTELAQLGDVLRLPTAAMESAEARALQVRQEVEQRNVRQLLIFDNAEAPEMIAAYLPSIGTAEVIITTNRRDFADIDSVFEVAVGLFTAKQGMAFLRETTGRNDEPGAYDLGEALGWLPLALSQAAPQIQRHYSYQQYLQLLESRPLSETLQRTAGAAHRHGAVRAILIAVDSLISLDSTGWSMRLIRLFSVLSADGVDINAVRNCVVATVSDADSGGVWQAVRRLADTNLITYGQTDGAPAILTVHRLTARVIRENMQADQLRETIDMAIAWLVQAANDLPSHAVSLRRDDLDRIVVHIAAVRRHASELTPDLLRLIAWAGNRLQDVGDLGRALPLLQSALADHAETLGANHPDTMTARNHLAYAYRRADRVAEAIALHEMNLAYRCEVLGPDHPDTLASQNDLGTALRSANRLDEAIALHERTLADRLRVLGPDSPYTFDTRNDLAFSYLSAGRVDEAIAVGELNLADRTRVLGQDHFDTLNSQNDLAIAYCATGRLDEAIALHEQTLADRARVLGATHPHTLRSRNNLGAAYEIAGRIGASIAMFEQAILGYRTALSPGHPWIAVAEANLAAARRKIELDRAVSPSSAAQM